MSRIYSTYDAKAKFSEIMRQVREGRTVTVSYHGEPVAEIRPLTAVGKGIAAQLERLAERGALQRAENLTVGARRVAKRPGALGRFLSERDE